VTCVGEPRRDITIVLGIILLVVAYLLGIPILWTLGIILVVVGVILVLLGAVGRPIGGRRHYW
jgi:Ca2+/Na+ antiporter